jgi:hypothetical protein
MEILGLEPVTITALICIIGVSFRIITGMAGKSWRAFSPTLATVTFMIGMVTSIGLVAPVINALPDDLDPTLQLAAVFGQIGLIMGIDSVSRRGHRIIQKRIAEKIEYHPTIEPEPIDDPDDLPPGKVTQ